MAMKVLFITSTYLGDAIISSGILDQTIQNNPKARVTVVAGSVPAPLFQNMPQVEKVIPLVKKNFSLHWFILWFKCLFYRWDTIIDVRGTGISYFLWTGKKYIWRSNTDQDLKVHQFARWLGLKETPKNKIWVSDQDLTAAKKIFGKSKIISISPAANWDKKCWPLDYFVDLCNDLTKKGGALEGHKIAVFGAPNQKKDLQPLFDQLPDALNLVGNINLPTVAACFQLSKIFIGNDSGLMHLAAASGVRTLGLFGPSPENIYGPWGGKALYIRTPESYDQAMAKSKSGENIMKNLQVKDVIAKIGEVLKL